MENPHAPNVLDRKKFSCLLCGEQFDNRQKVTHHVKLRKCKNNKNSNNMKPLAEMKAIDVNLIKCNDCGKRFLTKRQLLFHIKLKKCKPMKEPSQNSFPAKMVKHYQCQTCSKIFASNANYIRHYMGQHGVRRFVCDECGFRFNYQDSLRKHKLLKSSHKRMKIYLCNLCQDKFTNSKCLSSHLDMWHKIEQSRKKQISSEASNSSQSMSVDDEPPVVRSLNGLSLPLRSKNKAVKCFQQTQSTHTSNTKGLGLFKRFPTKLPHTATSKSAHLKNEHHPKSSKTVQPVPLKLAHPTNMKNPTSVSLKVDHHANLKSTNQGTLEMALKLTDPSLSKQLHRDPSTSGRSAPSKTSQPGPSKLSNTVPLKQAHSVPTNPIKLTNTKQVELAQSKALKQSYQTPKKLSNQEAVKPANYITMEPASTTSRKPIIKAKIKNKAYKSFNGITIPPKSQSIILKDCSSPKERPVNKAYKSFQNVTVPAGIRKWDIQKEMLKHMSSMVKNSTATTNTSTSSSDCDYSADENGYNTKPFICTDCGATFILLQSLRHHRQDKHNLAAAASVKQESIDSPFYEEKPFICSICNRVFIIEASLIIHCQEVHRGLTKLSEMPTIKESVSNNHGNQSPFEDDTFHGHSLRKTLKPVSYVETEVDDLVIDSDIEAEAQGSLRAEQYPQKSATVFNSPEDFEQRFHESRGLAPCYVPLEKLNDDKIKFYKTYLIDSRSNSRKSKSSFKDMTPFQIIQKFDIEVEDFVTLNCGICGMDFESLDAKISHLKSHKRSVQCKICKAIFTRRSSLKIHFVSQHFGKGLFFCAICKQSFNSKTNLKFHKKSHSETREKLFECTQCDATFRRQSSFDKHLKQHSSTSSYKCTCGGRFDTKFRRRIHRKTCSGIGAGSFPSCYVVLEKLTKDDINLYTNLPFEADEEIEDPSKLTCTEILDKYGIQAEEEDHGLSCGICGMFFDTLLEKQSHMRCHKYRNRCKACQKYFSSKTSLKRHYIGQHLGKKLFKCKYCGTDFKYRDMLNNHLRNHTKEPKMKCRYCPTQFLNYWARDKHEYHVHTGVKPYCCKFCQERFLVKNTYYLHQKGCAKKRNE